MQPSDSVVEAIKRLGPLAIQGVNLRTLTTFRVGGPADVFVRVHTMDEMRVVVDTVRATGVDATVVGQGSNLLVADTGIRGLVITLAGEFAATEFVDEANVHDVNVHDDTLRRSDNDADGRGPRSDSDHGLVVSWARAGAGVKMPVLARQAAARGRSGLEWMVGVPGSVGGGVRMNAGGHGSSVSENLIDVSLWSLDANEVRTVEARDLALTYRQSNLRDCDIVLSARFALGVCDAASAEAELAEIVRWRREHQPGGANCGSVFTNPPGDSAGRLIDAAGLRGLRLGTASVSEKHANFIQADDNASAADIWALIIEVRLRVFETFGIALHPEVRTAGFEAVLPTLSSTSPGGSHPTSDAP